MNNKTNMIKRKGLSRIIAVCIITVGIVSLFGGCKSNGKNNNTTNTTNSTTNTANNTASNMTTSNNNTATDNNSSNSGQTNDTNSSQQNNTANTTSQSSSTKKQTSSTINSNSVVYYLKGSKTYYLSKTDAALKKSKNILSITLKQAKTAGMHQAASKGI